MVLTLYHLQFFCFHVCNRLPERMKNGDAGIFPVYYSLKRKVRMCCYQLCGAGFINSSDVVQVDDINTKIPQNLFTKEKMCMAGGMTVCWKYLRSIDYEIITRQMYYGV